MDGVLVDSYEPHYLSWRETVAAEGIDLTRTKFAELFGRTSREIFVRLFGENRYSDAQIEDMDRRKETAYRRRVENDFPAMPGIHELLESLCAAGFKTAVGSSGPPENVALAVDKLGGDHCFDAIVTGMDVTRKARPAGFSWRPSDWASRRSDAS